MALNGIRSSDTNGPQRNKVFRHKQQLLVTNSYWEISIIGHALNCQDVSLLFRVVAERFGQTTQWFETVQGP